MNKIILQVYVPALGERYEMKIPRQLKVKQVTDIVSDYINNLGTGKYVPGDGAVLCDAVRGRAYSPNAFVEQLGLRNGDEILLI